MRARTPPPVALSVLLASLLVVGACADNSAAPTEPGVDAVPRTTQSISAVEAELLGKVFEGAPGEETSDTIYYFHLLPADSVTASYLQGTIFNNTLWIDPAKEFPISYFNPEGDGPVCGGSYENFFAGDLAGSAQEIHAPGPGSSPPAAFESHCLIPGTYKVQLIEGNPFSGGTVLKEFFVDYLAGEAGNLVGIGSDTLWIEAPAFDPATTKEWPDLVVHFDLESGSYAETASLQVENAHEFFYKPWFSAESSPSGTVTDWFRYRTDLSTSAWNHDTRGTHLIGLWYDNNDVFDRSGFFDHAERPVLRIHQYEGEVVPPATVVAGVEVKRPDEDPQNAPTVTRSISLVAATVACFDKDATSTWLVTDQFFDASCSEGSDLEYRWDTGSGFGSWTDDPILEFFGHSSSGAKTIKLEVRDLAQSPAPTDVEEESFGVSSSVVSMTGPTYVTNKQLKTYTASVTSDWYERYLSEGSTAWYLTLDSATTYNRIWAAGEYTRRLRAEKSSPSPLGRRFLDVEVCHESIPGCGGAQFAVLPGAGDAETSVLAEDWHLFGLGPWIQSGEDVSRFYDLTGLHETGSPFSDISWLEAPSGQAEDPAGRFKIEWRRVGSGDPNVQVVHFTITPLAGGPYRFGLAIDPDVGVSPADDRAGYDAAHGLVYAHDASGAVGFLLEGDAGRRIIAVDQYGARRFAPRSDEAALEAGGPSGARLLDGEDDVQFVVSGDPVSGPSTWRLTIVRASSARELRDRIDGKTRP